jgi:UDP-N-acetylglucosamine 2-epimerase (non-hydrolysing)
MKKILFVFGTRPEAIKMAPLIIEFKKSSLFKVKVCVTGQHREMLDQVLFFFKIVPDYDLDLMKRKQNLFDLTGIIITEIKAVYEEFNPDFVFVHGDTTTTFASSLAAFYFGAKVVHIEAGLRTNNNRNPFPEEMNRRLTSQIAEIHFAPTEKNKLNLIADNVRSEKIHVTGNTVVDAINLTLNIINKDKSQITAGLFDKIDFNFKTILITCHRRENLGENLNRICEAIKQLAANYPKVNFIFPVHLNPAVLEPVRESLGGKSNVFLLPPLDYPTFVYVMSKSYLILTDSGGIQEEAPSLGKPVLVLRDTTERDEALHCGTVKLIGTSKMKIIQHVKNLLTNDADYSLMSKTKNPYGDGSASKVIMSLFKEIK